VIYIKINSKNPKNNTNLIDSNNFIDSLLKRKKIEPGIYLIFVRLDKYIIHHLTVTDTEYGNIAEIFEISEDDPIVVAAKAHITV
jgi:hypothetical protein